MIELDKRPRPTTPPLRRDKRTPPAIPNIDLARHRRRRAPSRRSPFVDIRRALLCARARRASIRVAARRLRATLAWRRCNQRARLRRACSRRASHSAGSFLRARPPPDRKALFLQISKQRVHRQLEQRRQIPARKPMPSERPSKLDFLLQPRLARRMKPKAPRRQRLRRAFRGAGSVPAHRASGTALPAAPRPDADSSASTLRRAPPRCLRSTMGGARTTPTSASPRSPRAPTPLDICDTPAPPQCAAPPPTRSTRAIRKQRRITEIQMQPAFIELLEMRKHIRRNLISPTHELRKPTQQLLISNTHQTISLPHPPSTTRVFFTLTKRRPSPFQPRNAFQIARRAKTQPTATTPLNAPTFPHLSSSPALSSKNLSTKITRPTNKKPPADERVRAHLHSGRAIDSTRSRPTLESQLALPQRHSHDNASQRGAESTAHHAVHLDSLCPPLFERCAAPAGESDSQRTAHRTLRTPLSSDVGPPRRAFGPTLGGPRRRSAASTPGRATPQPAGAPPKNLRNVKRRAPSARTAGIEAEISSPRASARRRRSRSSSIRSRPS
jgi:hypothetical protein